MGQKHVSTPHPTAPDIFPKWEMDTNGHGRSTISRTEKRMEHLYDPLQGGEGFQQYFADMLLDSDRAVQYYNAIESAVKEFIATEKRAPVVLDVGCGTGLLTAFALVAGAREVIAVDFDKTHINALPSRLGADRMASVRSMHIESMDANPFARDPPVEGCAFDMLVSELLGTFSNSESAFDYLSVYERHMVPHESGIRYVVPRRVTQTVRACTLPQHVQDVLLRRFPAAFMPTELVGWLYEIEKPVYNADKVVIRVDRFTESPFVCEQPRRKLHEGTYVAEWVAELWTGILLQNTWTWSFAVDSHSKHARARNWGLMVFHVPKGGATVNDVPDVREGVPSIVSRGARLALDADGRSDDRHDNLRFYNPRESANSNLYDYETLHDIYDDIQPPDHAGKGKMYTGSNPTSVKGYLRADMAATGMPATFPSDLFHRTTLGAVVAELVNLQLRGRWFVTLDIAAVFPFLFSTESSSVLDEPVDFIPPCDSGESVKRLTVGSLMRIA